MATSGTITTTTTAKEIIQETLEMLGALGEGELANAQQETSLLRTLRNLCTAWQADGLNLFAVESVVLLLNPGQISYRIPSDDTVTASDILPNNVSSYLTAGSTNVTFTEAIDTTHTVCGLLQEDNTLHLANMFNINGATCSIDIATQAAVAAGASAYTFIATTPSRRFMKALHGSYLNHSGTSIPMEAMSRNDYDALSKKTSTGIPLQYYVDTQTTYNEVYIWPTANSPTQLVRLDVQRQLDSVTATTDDLAFPGEWFLPLATNLAHVSSSKYGLPLDDTRRLQLLAEKYYEMASDFDFEWGTSIYFQPNAR